MHNLWGFFLFFSKIIFFAENHFLIAAINVTTRCPLYTCLVFLLFRENHSYDVAEVVSVKVTYLAVHFFVIVNLF